MAGLLEVRIKFLKLLKLSGKQKKTGIYLVYFVFQFNKIVNQHIIEKKTCS